VVIELTVQTYKIESVFVSLLAWPLTVENLRKAINFGDAHNDDKDMMTYILVTHASGTNHKVVIHQLVYFGDKVRQRHQWWKCPLKETHTDTHLRTKLKNSMTN
jgi:hypothetical protein